LTAIAARARRTTANEFFMIGPVQIQNYKSIRELKFDASRVNVFIGEPNSGKSNIIEALSFFAEGALSNFKEVFRFKSLADLFFDQKVSKGLRVQFGRWEFDFKFKETAYQGQFLEEVDPATKIPKGGVGANHQNLTSFTSSALTPVRFYSFKGLNLFSNSQPGDLNPPFGDNLVAVLYTNEELRQRIGSIVRQKGFRLHLKPTENELMITKDLQDELYSYPWKSVSETIQRVVFFMAVLETNKGKTLLFDEPETNTFPFYTKYLAERIALDETNQFFITTHNPYLLSSIVEKTPKDKLAVFVTRMEKFETIVKRVPEKNLPELLELDADAFFNLDKLVEE
jgi:AAA ATPase domain/AAA domain, putative AbiEii toxin, Type IV TA system